MKPWQMWLIVFIGLPIVIIFACACFCIAAFASWFAMPFTRFYQDDAGKWQYRVRAWRDKK